MTLQQPLYEEGAKAWMMGRPNTFSLQMSAPVIAMDADFLLQSSLWHRHKEDKKMSEIRINMHRSVEEEYRDYPELIQLYHQYDIYVADYESRTEDELKEHIAECHQKKLMILSRMTEKDYEDLQRSMEGHITQQMKLSLLLLMDNRYLYPEIQSA